MNVSSLVRKRNQIFSPIHDLENWCQFVPLIIFNIILTSECAPSLNHNLILTDQQTDYR